MIMEELIEEHRQAAGLIERLHGARVGYGEGREGALDGIITTIDELTELYTRHVHKEDRHFFFPSMEYFTEDEEQEILAGMESFDREVLHTAYGRFANELEAGAG